MTVAIKPTIPAYKVTIGGESKFALVSHEQEDSAVWYRRETARFAFYGYGDIAPLGEQVTHCSKTYEVFKRDHRKHSCYCAVVGASLEAVGVAPYGSTVTVDVEKFDRVYGDAALTRFVTFQDGVQMAKVTTERKRQTDQSGPVVETTETRFYMLRSLAAQINVGWQINESGTLWRIVSLGDVEKVGVLPYAVCEQLPKLSP